MQRDVIIIGAGPAGIGCAIALQRAGVHCLTVVDRDRVGASFRKWPPHMRFLTPSFYSNPFQLTDLNSVTPSSSPGDFLRREHPAGDDYAAYLEALASHYQLPVREGVEVDGLQRNHDGFVLQTSAGRWHARFVIWAAGEFGRPWHGGIEGAEHALHNSAIHDYDQLPGVEHVVIGGYESGMDTMVMLAERGRVVHLFARGEPWKEDHADPSISLSPHTVGRVREVLARHRDRLRFNGHADVRRIQTAGDDCWRLQMADGSRFDSTTPPILCTGFKPVLGPVDKLFECDDDGLPVVSEDADESTLTDGLFYSGPRLSHRGSRFCFVYKFRSRFGVIASAIADRLGADWQQPMELYEKHGFLIRDPGCCVGCECPAGQVEPEEESRETPAANRRRSA